jgi:hypothetical protein
VLLLGARNLAPLLEKSPLLASRNGSCRIENPARLNQVIDRGMPGAVDAFVEPPRLRPMRFARGWSDLVMSIEKAL